jgi:hypothetical protein
MLSGSNWRSQTIDTKIPKGTKIKVRTAETIEATACDGQLFPGIVDRDVIGSSGNVLVYKGEVVCLRARRTSDNQIALDVNSINTNDERFVAMTPRYERECAPIASTATGMAMTCNDIPCGSLIIFRLTVPFDVQS